jgi:hypothetical protein
MATKKEIKKEAENLIAEYGKEGARDKINECIYNLSHFMEDDILTLSACDVPNQIVFWASVAIEINNSK